MFYFETCSFFQVSRLLDYYVIKTRLLMTN